MPLEELQLTATADFDNDNTDENREYDIYPIQTVDLTSRKDAFSIAPPGLAAKENILLGVSGMQADIEIQATVWDDGTDRANGTAPTGVFTNDTVVTVAEQIQWLEEYIHAPDFGVAWTLDHLTGAAFNDDEVFVEEVSPTIFDVDSPKWKPVTIRLRRGGSVG
jgi:hypothetical protein